jgi:hypothetical protein
MNFLTSDQDYSAPDEWESSESSPLSVLIDLSFVCPLAVYFMQFAIPAIFSDLLPREGKSDVWLLNIAILGLSYIPSLLTRFVLLKRPVKSFTTTLFLFPMTLFFADLCSSVILRSFFFPSSHQFEYIPVFYLAGWSLFILLYAHCTILKMSFYIKKHIPLIRRITAYTLTLALSLTLSMLLCIAFNGQFDKKSSAFAASTPSTPEDRRQPLEFPDTDVQSRDLYLFRR